MKRSEMAMQVGKPASLRMPSEDMVWEILRSGFGRSIGCFSSFRRSMSSVGSLNSFTRSEDRWPPLEACSPSGNVGLVMLSGRRLAGALGSP